MVARVGAPVREQSTGFRVRPAGTVPVQPVMGEQAPEATQVQVSGWVTIALSFHIAGVAPVHATG